MYQKKAPEHGIVRNMSLLADEIKLALRLDHSSSNILVLRKELSDFDPSKFDAVISLTNTWFKDEETEDFFRKDGHMVIREPLYNLVCSSAVVSMKPRESVYTNGIIRTAQLSDWIKVKEICEEKEVFYVDFLPSDPVTYRYLCSMVDEFQGNKKTTYMSLPLVGKKELNDHMDFSKTDNMDKLKNLARMLFELGKGTKKVHHNSTVTLSEDTSSVASLQTHLNLMRKNLTVKSLDTFYRMRHDCLHFEVARLLDVSTQRSDVDLVEMFNYEGIDCFKTPDMAYITPDGRTTYLIDVAVTAGSVEDLYSNKIKKYEMAARGIEMSTGLDIGVEAVVLSSQYMGNLQIPHFMKDYRDEMLDLQAKLVEMTKITQTLTNYERVKAAFDAKETEDDTNEKEILLKDFLRSYLDVISIRGKMSSELSDSFHVGPNDMDVNYSSCEDDKMITRIKEDFKTFDPERAKKAFKKEIFSRLREGKIPLSLEKVLNHEDLGELSMTMIKRAQEVRKRALCKEGFKIPKVFKFVDMVKMKANQPLYSCDTLGKWVTRLEDGTVKIRLWTDLPESTHIENRGGIGIDVREDYESMMALSSYLSEDSSMEFRTTMDSKLNLKETTTCNKLKRMMKVKVMELAHYVERLARNLIYMEGRRMEEGSKFSVFKAFPEDGYSLIVHKGSRITKEAQIRYKLVTMEGDSDTEFFHKLEHTSKGYSETGWLSMSQCDLQTFSCMFEKMVALMSHYHDCYMEGNPSSLLGIDTLMKEDYFMVPAIILLEQKRGTSTTCQYNRYILNSMTGYRSNKGKMMTDIMAYPVRSKVEAFVRSKQIDWSLKLLSGASSCIVESVKNKISTSSDYDRFECPSIFSNNTKMEFTFLMNDIYLGNLFQKDAGFSSHRSKAIIQKQTIEEIHHLKMRNGDTMNANVEVDDCFMKKDENHQYSKDFMMLSGHELGMKMRTNPRYVTGILKVATANLHEAMMMTSSLKECKIRTKTLFNSSKKVNTTSHETLKDLIDEHGTPSMLGIISREVFIDAVFSMFPKPQIGGPREILIQSYKLRVHMKFFESICEEFCKMLDKEMLTGSREKEMRQSTTSTEFKRKLINEKIKRNLYGLTPTIVADASRWSPSFTMPMFCHFVVALGLPEEITDHALAVIKSFSAKMMHLPEALCEKWKNKPVAQREEDEELEWLRTNTDPFTRVHRVTSGMGQGMFHRFSSLIHVAKDDISDQFINDYLKLNGVSFESRTMVSSDDMMKQMLITSTSMKSLLKSIDSLLIIYEVTNRLSNIHINWKKTALSFIIDEFNSYFTVGNRACLAVIKDVFTAMEPVDLTEPLHAVSEVLQNISRALRNGAYLPTVEVMFKLMRSWLIESYAIEESTITSLKDALNCTSDQLPMDLGFLSCNHILGQVIFGNQILMYDPNNSENLNKFYRGTYTCLREEADENTSEDYMVSLSGKVKICLPFRTDKKMRNMIANYHARHNIVVDTVMEEEEKTSLMMDHSDLSWMKHKLFTRSYFIGKGRRYGFGDSLKTHTMVRALQYRRRTLMTRPKLENEGSWDVVSFTFAMMARSEMNNGMKIMACFEKMMDKVVEAESHFSTCSLSSAVRHTRKRKILFRTREVVMRADPEEIFSLMTKKGFNISNRLQAVVTDICELLDINVEEFRTDALGSVLKSMSGFKYPMTTFKLLLKDYIENRLDFGSDFMISEVDQGNVVDNILMVYRDRADPRAPLQSVKTNNMKVVREGFSTVVSIGRDIREFTLSDLDLDDNFHEEIKFISLSDSPLDRSIKLLSSEILSLPMRSDFIFHTMAYKRRVSSSKNRLMNITHAYSNLETTWMVNVDHLKKKVVLEAFSMMDILIMDPSIKKLVAEDLRKENAVDYPQSYWNGTREMMSLTEPTKGFIMRNSIEMARADWKVHLMIDLPLNVYRKDIKVLDFRVSKEKYYVYGDMLNTLSMQHEDDRFYLSFHDFMNTDMDALSLQRFVRENDLCENNIIPNRRERNKDMIPLSVDAEAYSSQFMMQAMMECFEDDEDEDFDFGEMFKVKDELLTKDEMGEMASGFADIDGWADILAAAMDVDESPAPVSVPSSERIHMTELLTRNVAAVIRSLFKIQYTDITEALSTSKDPGAKRSIMIWSMLATSFKESSEINDHWLVRMALVFIYARIRTRHDIPVPSEVFYIEGKNSKLVSFVKERSKLKKDLDSIEESLFDY